MHSEKQRERSNLLRFEKSAYGIKSPIRISKNLLFKSILPLGLWHITKRNKVHYQVVCYIGGKNVDRVFKTDWLC